VVTASADRPHLPRSSGQELAPFSFEMVAKASQGLFPPPFWMMCCALVGGGR
jgi:hypothetical protein